MARLAVLLAALIVLVLPCVLGAKFGWVYSGPAEPSGTTDGLQTREFRILSGLKFWNREAFSKRGAQLLTNSSTFGFDAAYASLCTQDAKFLVGPASWQATFDVLSGSAVNSTCKNSLWGFLIMDDQLEAMANAADINWFSLSPRIPLDNPFTIPVLKRLLLEQDHFTWSILTAQTGLDPELDLVSALGLAIAANLTVPDTDGLTYTVFSNEVYDPQDISTGNSSVVDFVRAMANKRPEVNVFAIGAPTDDANFTKFVDDTFAVLSDHKPDPDTVMLLAPVEFYDLSDQTQKRIKYWSALAYWDHRYRWKHDKDTSKSLGSAEDYWEDFKDVYGRHPGNWDALASATALVLDHAEFTPGGLSAVKFNSFWQPLDFTAIPTPRRMPAEKWLAVQFLHGDTRSIGESKADQKDVDSPGRWKWKSYSLTSDAIAAIVLGVILMCLGLAIAVFATYKFVGLWLNPPSHSDEKDDEKDKTD